MMHPWGAADFEKTAPIIAQTREGEESRSKKRKHFEDEERDITASDNQEKQNRTQTYWNKEPQRYQTFHDPPYQVALSAAGDYVPPTRTYAPLDQRSAIPSATPSYVPSRAPSLPGAALYKQQRRDLTTPSPSNNSNVRNTSGDREFLASAHFTSLSPVQDQTHRHLDLTTGQYKPQHVYPLKPENSVGWSTSPMGTQHNPLEIASSPELEPKPYGSNDPKDLDLSGMQFGLENRSPSSAAQVAVPSKVQEPFIDPEPVLKPEQQKVVDLILQGHNVFYTGSAGCGKSTILKAFVKQLQLRGKRVKIVAPTNLAALNVGGVTTWSFAGWTPDSMKKSLDKLMQAAHGKEIWERFDTTDVLVIDEISMVENLLFERLNHAMKASRGERYGGGPFGGVQVIVTGDFCQLSPVRPFQYCIGCGWELERDNKYRPKEYRCENKYCREDLFYDVDKWAFRSKAWEECDFKHVNLTEIHRQSDKKFISILQKIRTDGVILKPHANILLNHTSETEDAVKLFARRDDVDRINNENIAKLPSEARTYKCIDNFSWKDHHKNDTSLEKNTRPGEDDTLAALKEHRYEVYVKLKEGMRVVLQANLEPSMGLVNGSQGVITSFEPFDEKRLPRKAENRNDVGLSDTPFIRGAHARYFEEQIKVFGKTNKRQPWPIVKFDNGLTRTIFADCTASELGNEEPFSLLSRTQIPLMAGYAITVHKSQGMTLDRVIVDLSRAFEPSQIYVALSRARSLKGLKVIGLPRSNLGGANEQVKEFFEKYLRKS